MNLQAILQKRARTAAVWADRIANLRAAAFVATLAAVAALWGWAWPWACAAAIAGAAGFAALVAWHGRMGRTRRKYEQRLAMLMRQEARRGLDWPRLRPLGLDRELPRVFWDLDIAGTASVLTLANECVSEEGEAALVSLFDGAAGTLTDEEIRKRQALVRELKRLRLLRSRFLLASDGRAKLGAVAALVARPAHGPGAIAWVWAQGLLQLISHLGFVVWLLHGGAPWFLAGWAAVFLVFRAGERAFDEPFERALALEGHLSRFSRLTGVLENHRPAAGSALASELAVFHGEDSPSRLLKRIARWVSLLSVQANPGFHFIFNLAVPWDFVMAMGLERTRQRLAARAGAWISALSRFEALLSLASFAEAFPETSFPELEGDAWVEAADLAHPLIPAERRVSNDVSLDATSPCWIITGSNMSGKSTFLRTVGVNVLLAQAGAPVFARRFRWRRAGVWTSLRTRDSLQDEVSTFYAEVRQLKRILDAASDPRPNAPALYLIDEIFQGTNNRERLQGSRAYIEALLRTPSAGLIATHDLELGEMERTDPKVRNVHFRETIEDGRMSFSYRLQEGVSPSTNALRIMELEGLPVPGSLRAESSRRPGPG